MKQLASPLYIFTHLPKSAGINITQHFTKHLPNNKWLNIYPTMLGISEFEPQKLPPATKKYFNQLSTQQKQQLEYVYGHTLFYGIHQLINPNRNSFYFTFIRDPAERIVSLYNYYSQWYWLDPKQVRQQKDLYRKIILYQGEWPDFMTWYKKVFKPAEHKLEMYPNLKYFQKLGYLATGPITTQTINNCLDKFSFVGLVESFESDSLYLYHLWGINKFFIRQNISQKKIHLSQHPRIKDQFHQDLKNEYLFYQLAQKKRHKFIDSHPEYYPIVKKMKIKKRLLTPVTQALFAWPDNLHLISSHLHRIVPGYTQLKDFLSHYDSA